MIYKLRWHLIAIGLGLLITACSSSSPAPTPDTTAPTISLSASPSSLTSTGNVTLSATATDAVGVVKVMFFEGSTQIGEDTSAPYTWSDPLTSAQNGTRNYTARAFDAAGNVGNSELKSVVVNIPVVGVNRPPVAAFSPSSAGLVASVTNTSSDPDGDPLSHSWDWGDSTTPSSGATPNHTYAAAGTYTITLTVSDGRGATNTTTRNITVSSGGGGSSAGVWDSSNWDGANFQ
jgi:chitinase